VLRCFLFAWLAKAQTWSATILVDELDACSFECPFEGNRRIRDRTDVYQDGVAADRRSQLALTDATRLSGAKVRPTSGPAVRPNREPGFDFIRKNWVRVLSAE
jgi:hypothetical protein